MSVAFRILAVIRGDIDNCTQTGALGSNGDDI